MSDRLQITDGPCDTEAIAEYEATRREAVRRGLAAGGAVIAAASVPFLLRTRNAFAQADSDETVLQSAAQLELEAAVAYDTMAKSGLLRGPVARLIRLFRDQEQQHSNVVSDELEALGGEAPDTPEPAEIQGLGGLAGEPQMLGFAMELENSLLQAYVEAHEKLQSEHLLKIASQIMSNEGQHLVTLRLALGTSPLALVPSAFETGTDPAPSTGFLGG